MPGKIGAYKKISKGHHGKKHFTQSPGEPWDGPSPAELKALWKDEDGEGLDIDKAVVQGQQFANIQMQGQNQGWLSGALSGIAGSSAGIGASMSKPLINLQPDNVYSPTYSGEVWTTKNGTKVLLRDMEDSHLQNSAEMVKRSLKIAQDKVIGLQATAKKLETERIRRVNEKAAQKRAVLEAAMRNKVERRVVPANKPNGRKFREG